MSDQARVSNPVVPANRAPEGPTRSLAVTAPSRLHLGLFSFGHPTGRRFGGVGLMIEQPAIQLQIAAAEHLELRGLLADRVGEYARRWSRFYGLGDEPACRITLEAAPESHVGLGVGTQVGLAVAAGLNALFQHPQPLPDELALSVGRAGRSAVGTYGFVFGGLIVERGKLPTELVSPLEARLDLPPQWRFVLLQPQAPQGLAGQAEQDAFATLPPVPAEVTAELIKEVRESLLPAAAGGDFETFSRSVYDYGRVAGLCFAKLQGGPYNGARLQQLVDLIRDAGVTGVGQSSWGPTLFAILPDEVQARQFVAHLAAAPACRGVRFSITAANNSGARIQAG